MERTVWIDSVWDTLRTIPLNNAVGELESAWLRHRDRTQPVAVIFGAYDAGKSSLLKRLLFDDGKPIPPEVTVSARRETFSVDEVSGATWTFRDTPGLAGGNNEHDLKALESLDLADLFVWVLPPQLVTSNKSIFEDIITGKRFGVEPSHVADALVAVISRIDEAGIDPIDNSEGFRDLCQRKKLELADLMRGSNAGTPQWGVCAVSADPYQRVGNDQPAPGIYAEHSVWDGVAELRSKLSSAHNSAAKLRILAGFRFASRAIFLLSKILQDERARREETSSTCRNELQRVVHWRSQLEALRRNCIALLHRVIEDEMLNATRAGSAVNAQALQERMSDAIDRWSSQAYADFKHLAAAAGQEVGERSGSPSMEQVRSILTQIGQEESESDSNSLVEKAKQHGKTVTRALKDGFKGFAKVDLGISTEEAAKLLNDFKQSGKTWEVFQKANKGKTFATEEIMKKASKYVKWAETMSVVAPLVEQLGPLLVDVVDDIRSASLAKEKADKRKELRDALENAARGVEKEATTGFEELLTSFTLWLDRQEDLHTRTMHPLDAQVEAIARYQAQLAALLDRRPA